MEDFNKTLLNIILTNVKQPAPMKTSRTGKHWEWVIGVGKDHVAYLTMDDEAYQELVKNVIIK